MKKSISPNAMRITVVGLLSAAICAGVIVIVHAGGLATRNVGEISAKLEIADESNVKQCLVTGTQTYLQSTKEGMAQLLIKKDGVRVASASARIRADTEVQAAAGVSALVLYLTGRPGLPAMQCLDIPGDGRGFECSEIKFEGDSRFVAEHADKIIDWWDANASLTHTSYVSPKLNLNNLGKLQLNARSTSTNMQNANSNSLAILLFSPDDPGSIVGGIVSIETDAGVFVSGPVVSGWLTDKTNTPSPGDFVLAFQVDDSGFLRHFQALVAIDFLADGTIDVRGVSRDWPFEAITASYLIEGTGNTKFVLPSQ